MHTIIHFKHENSVKITILWINKEKNMCKLRKLPAAAAGKELPRSETSIESLLRLLMVKLKDN